MRKLVPEFMNTCAAIIAAFMCVLVSAPAQTNNTGQLDAPALLKAGRAAMEDKLFELAQVQIEQYLGKSPAAGRDTEEAFILLMRALHAQGKNTEILALQKSRKSLFEKAEKADAFIFWRAFALYELGRYDDALRDLNEFRKAYSSSEYSGRVMRLMAWCYIKTGKTGEALQAFSDYDRTFGNSAEAAQNLLEWGKILLSSKKTDEAHAVLSRLIKMPQDQPVVQNGLYWYGMTLIEEKKWDESSSVLLGLVANTKIKEDLRAEALLAVAVPLNAVSRKDDALDALRRGVELAKSAELKQRAEFEFAKYLIEIGRLDQGIPALKQWIAKDPSNPMAESAQLKIAASLKEHGKYKESVDEYQHFLETFTNVTGQAEAFAGKGWALTGLNRYAESASTFLKAFNLSTDPARREECLFKVGDAYYLNGQFSLAMETYERFLKEFPQSKLSANALFQVAECVARVDKPSAAETKFRDVSERYPGTTFAEESLMRIGELRMTEGKWLEGIFAFNKVMGSYSNGMFYAQALHGRGMASYQLTRFDEALKDFETITNRFIASPVFEHSFYMNGRCVYWLGNDARAMLICRDFIKKYPDSQWAPEAMFWMANHEYNEASYETAEKDFLAFVQKYPKSVYAANALYWAGLAASKRKEYIRSVELLSRLAKEYPESKKMVEARFAQAEALVELARFSEAILIYDEIITKYPASSMIIAAWGRRGDCQFSLGADDRKRYEESIESFKVVLNNSSASPDQILRAEYQIGRCMEKLGRTPDAFQQYYKNVILRFFEAKEKGIVHNEACKVWFTRAVLNAADLMEIKKDWRAAVSVLERLISAGVPGADEARARIAKLKAEHWWLFYNE